MAEYIERKAVINDIGELFTLCNETLPNAEGHHFIVESELQTHLDHVKSLPAADVVEVRHGTWIKADEQPYFRKHYHAKVCSECGKRKDGKWLYCPYCGSKNQDGGKVNG